MKKSIVICTIRPWNIKNAKKLRAESNKQYSFHIISEKDKLNFDIIARLDPAFIFFPHWSWIIPEKIYKNYKSILFHMTDLPFGRGGSPLQNLIVQKVYDTKITAIEVVKELDAGKVYHKKDFSIRQGSAQDIFKRVSDIIFFEMIPYILKKQPVPKSQKGRIVKFKRRKAESSEILKASLHSLNDLYDHIRMLDAEGYPRAFLKIKNFKITFSGIKKASNKLKGRFEITDENE